MNNKLLSYEKDLVDHKKYKLQRDIRDYEHKKAFVRSANQRPKRRSVSFQKDRSVSGQQRNRSFISGENWASSVEEEERINEDCPDLQGAANSEAFQRTFWGSNGQNNMTRKQELAVLNKGLKFILTVLPRIYEIKSEIFGLVHKMHLKDYFYSIKQKEMMIDYVETDSESSECTSTTSECKLEDFSLSGYRRNGDVIIGGLFTCRGTIYTQNDFRSRPSIFSCTGIDITLVPVLQAMVFATDEINKNFNLLPNTSLGFGIYEVCFAVSRTLLGTFQLLSGEERNIPNYHCTKGRTSPLAGIIGEANSELSKIIATVLGIYRFPQISSNSLSLLLNDKFLYPSFLRTRASSLEYFLAVVQMIKHFGWTWVGILADLLDTAIQISQKLKAVLDEAGICVEFQTYLSNFDQVAENIISSSSKVILVISSNFGATLDALSRKHFKGKVWVGGQEWPEFVNVSKHAELILGTLWFSFRTGRMPGFIGFLSALHPLKNQDDPFTVDVWKELLGCTWYNSQQNLTGNNDKTICTGTGTISFLNNPYLKEDRMDIFYRTYNAVYAFAHALHNLHTCIPTEGPFVNGSCSKLMNFIRWQLFHYLKNVQFSNPVGDDISFDEAGNIIGIYDILNWQCRPDGVLSYQSVGAFHSKAPSGKTLLINDSAIMWHGGQKQVPRSVCTESCPPGFRKARQQGRPICCFDCIACSEGEIANQTDAVICLQCPPDQWPNAQQNKCTQKPVVFLRYDDPLGAALASIAICCSLLPAVILVIFIKFAETPVVRANNRHLSYLLLTGLMFCFLCSLIFLGHPSTVSCVMRHVVFGIIFVLSISSVLAKTITVVIAFNATKPNSSLTKWVGPQLSYMIVGICTFLQVAVCVTWIISSPPFPQKNFNLQPGNVIIECNEGSTIIFYFLLGYMGFLASISFVVAFMARKLPDSFNEAKFITFSTLVFVSVWISFIPAYLSTQGKYTTAVEIFAIISSAGGLLVCIFFPKCYLVLWRSERNTKEYLMGKGMCTSKNIK
ncbi:extracellular calcium-sensing receptor-like [Protopterus annectens]|uniref:extracellular calcium-sensing receptor-like n=1 Tax=Protopterus annectens TaxID=7888 RepID=UPI001CFA4868|nr:extracellular calcium-sensing receptor-like [Protopterus annectens]